MGKYFFDITAWQIERRASSSVPTEGVGGYNHNLVAEKQARVFRAKNLEDAKHFTDALQHSDTCSEQVQRAVRSYAHEDWCWVLITDGDFWPWVAREPWHCAPQRQQPRLNLSRGWLNTYHIETRWEDHHLTVRRR